MYIFLFLIKKLGGWEINTWEGASGKATEKKKSRFINMARTYIDLVSVYTVKKDAQSKSRRKKIKPFVKIVRLGPLDKNFKNAKFVEIKYSLEDSK